MGRDKETVTIRCNECGNDITTLSIFAGIGTATCELCRRTRDGLPIPTMEQYRPSGNLAFDVAKMMGDESVLEQFQKPYVAVEIPQSLAGRLIEKVKRTTLRRPKLTPIDETGKPVIGKSAEAIAKTKRREPLF